MSGGRTRLLAGFAIAALLVLTAIGVQAGGILHTRHVDRLSHVSQLVAPSPAPSRSPSTPRRSVVTAPAQAVGTRSGRLSTPALLIALAIAGGLLAAAAIRYAAGSRQRRPSVPEDTSTGPAERERLLAEARDASAWLESETDPRTVVIGCWLRLEAMTGAAGVPRNTGETAGELALRVLGHWPIDAAPLERLRERFEAARFSFDSIGAADVAIARQALAAVAEGLQGAGPTADHPERPVTAATTPETVT